MKRSSSGPVLGDDLGPRAQRMVNIVSAVVVLLLAALVWIGVQRLRSNGQLTADKWRWSTNLRVQRFLLVGLLNTVKVAVVAMVLSLAVGALLALGRVAPQRPVRFVATVVIEFFRAMPLLLLILFIGLTFPTHHLPVGAFWYLVIGLTAYNGAVLGEVFRAGIASLDRGQTEAAQALGMRWWQTMRLVVVPQALRRMVPAIVSQLVTLLKDTSLGYVLPYEELLRRGRELGQDFTLHQPALQSLIEVAALYAIVNFTLSRIARRLELHQRRSGRGAAPAVTGALEMAALDAQARTMPDPT